MDLILSMVVLIITCVGVYYTRKQYLLQRKKKLVNFKPASPDKISQSDIEQKSKPLMIRSKNLSKNDIETFSMLIEASVRLLEKDRLSGCWGRTIYKHINITQYGSVWTDQRIYKYIIAGSLTHTFHALNGLFPYYNIANKAFSPEIVQKILKYLSTWRLDWGAFATPVTNFDASIGSPESLGRSDQEIFRSQDPQLLRHTACGILTINRLLLFRDNVRKKLTDQDNLIHFWEQTVGTLNAFNLKALRVLSGHADIQELKGVSVWGKVKYTPSYIILAIDEGVKLYHEVLKPYELKRLERFKSNLVNFVFENGLEEGERF